MLGLVAVGVLRIAAASDCDDVFFRRGVCLSVLQLKLVWVARSNRSLQSTRDKFSI